MTCAQCNRNDCVCAFTKPKAEDIEAFIKQTNAGQDAMRASNKATELKAHVWEFLDSLWETPKFTVPGCTFDTMELRDALCRAYNDKYMPKPKEYSCANCSGTFTTIQQPHICPFCQQARLSTKG